MRPALPFDTDLATGGVLSFIGGLVDAVGFISLFGLFTAHVTGNFVIIADQLAIGGGGVIAKVLALPVFMLAVAVARIIALVLERRNISPSTPLLSLEAVLLVGAGAWGLALSPISHPDAAGPIMIGMLAVAAMGVQNGFGRLAIAHLPATTVMTVNVAQLTIDVVDLALARNRTKGPALGRVLRMGASVTCFGLGAFAGAFGFALWSFAVLAIPALLLLLTIVVIRRRAAPPKG